jgi:hypothetical protein
VGIDKRLNSPESALVAETSFRLDPDLLPDEEPE